MVRFPQKMSATVSSLLPLMWSCVKSVPLGAVWEGAWLGGNAKI